MSKVSQGAGFGSFVPHLERNSNLWDRFYPLIGATVQMQQKPFDIFIRRKLPTIAWAIIVLAVLYAASLYNYLFFHVIAEGFSIAVACSVFMVVWNTRRHTSDHYILFIGIAYLFIAIIDFAHTCSYKGMNIFRGYDANAATQLWIAARYLESLTLFASAVVLRRERSPVLYFLIYGILVSAILLSVFYWRNFPDCFLADAGGLTRFKIISEYIICLILVASGIAVFKRRGDFDPGFLKWFLLSIFVTVLSELAFTTYASVFGFSNLLGHFLKILSFYFIYKAIIETGLSKPYEILFRRLQKDISERKAAEKALKRSTARWNAAIDSFAEGAIIATEEEQLIYWNPSASEMHGFSRPEEGIIPLEQTGATFQLWTMDGSRMLDMDEWPMRRLKRGETVKRLELRLRRIDQGWEKIVSYSGAMVETDGGERLIFLSVFDLTEQRKAEAAQKLSKERQEILAQVSERLLRAEDPQVIVADICRLVMAQLDCQFFFNFLVEEPKKRLQLNAYAGIPKETADEIRQLDFGVAVCGYVAQEGRRIIAEDIQNGDDTKEQLIKSFGVKAYCCHPLMAQDKLIGTLSFGTRTRPTFADDEVALMKSVCDLVAVAMQRLLVKKELQRFNQKLEQEVARRTRQSEQRSIQLQALAVELIEAEEHERRRIADHLHEDLQQILAAAKMQMESICQVQPNEWTLWNVKQLLEESIEKSRSLTHELSPPVLQHANLVAALQWLARYFFEQFGLQVELQLGQLRQDESEPTKVFLFRAVQELLFNVVKHAGVKKSRIDLAADNGNLVLTVSDQGRGFDPQLLDSTTTHFGIGLLSLRERARYIGGDLFIESNSGQGSGFTLKVPFNIEKTEKRPRPAAILESSNPVDIAIVGDDRDISVLFVDDHKVMRQGLINLVGAQPGIRVAGEASNGKEAIDRVRQLKPDVVVMDISMPEMDGIEATRRIKAQWPDVRVIALSMVQDEHVTRAMFEAGAEAFVSKGASSAELLQAVFGMNRIQSGN